MFNFTRLWTSLANVGSLLAGRSVRGKLLWLVIGGAFATVLCCGLLLIQARQTVQSEVLRSRQQLAKTYASMVEVYLQASSQDLEHLATSSAMRAPLQVADIQPELHGVPETAAVAQRDVAQRFLKDIPRFSSVSLLNVNYDLYLLEPYAGQIGLSVGNLGQRDFYRTARMTGQTTWGGAFLNAAAPPVPSVVLATGIRGPNGDVQSVLGAALDLDQLATAAQGVQAGEKGAVMLFDGRGVPIVFPDAARVQAGQPLTELPLVANALNGQFEPTTYVNPLTGQEELGAIVPIPRVGWYAAVSQTTDAAFARVDQVMLTMAALVIGSAAALLVGGSLLANSISRAVAQVDRAARGIAEGDLDQDVDIESHDELGRMAAAFRDMIQYQQRMAALADAVAAGDLSVDAQPQSSRDRLGLALQGMVANLRGLVERLDERRIQAEELVGTLQQQIDERQQAEDALRLRDRALEATSSPVMITEARSDERPICYVNPAFERMSGYTADEIIGRSPRFMVGAGTDPAFVAELTSTILAGRSGTFEALAYRKGGASYWSEVALAPVTTPAGEVSHFVWVANDITARKEAEQQAGVFARAEKLRALGQMASGIAHDLNQSLMLISSYSDLARQELEKEDPNRDELREMFTTAAQAAMDGGETVKRLLLFTRAPVEGNQEYVDLGQLLRETVQLTAPRWRDATQVEGRPISLDVVATGCPLILGSPARLREAFTNLIFNAVDAMPQGGWIHVTAKVADGQAVVTIADSGLGMTREVQDQIFEPFFTTKGDKGTGLGLAMVFGLTDSHQGEIDVESEPGKGTTFTLRFPLASPPEPQVAASPPAAPVREKAHALKILVVDDEPSMSKAVKRMLRPGGHAVTTADSGEEALECLARDQFDLVISDMGMGAGMNGWELGRAVREHWPGTRFVLATGWGAAIGEDEAHAKGVEAVLSKPYSVADLERVVAGAA